MGQTLLLRFYWKLEVTPNSPPQRSAIDPVYFFLCTLKL